MTVLGNLAAYLILSGAIIRLAMLAKTNERLLRAYRENAAAQEERHRAMSELVSALHHENALLKQEKALSATAAKHRE